MQSGFVSLASSSERETLERLEQYLAGRGVECWVAAAGDDSDRFALLVHEPDAATARRALQDIVLPEGDGATGDDVVEIRCEDGERDEIAAWLQSLLDEHDHDGSHVFFYRDLYERILDDLLASARAEIPVFLLRGLHAFLPEPPRRLMMTPALREFFHLITAVSEEDG